MAGHDCICVCLLQTGTQFMVKTRNLSLPEKTQEEFDFSSEVVFLTSRRWMFAGSSVGEDPEYQVAMDLRSAGLRVYRFR